MKTENRRRNRIRNDKGKWKRKAWKRKKKGLISTILSTWTSDVSHFVSFAFVKPFSNFLSHSIHEAIVASLIGK